MTMDGYTAYGRSNATLGHSWPLLAVLVAGQNLRKFGRHPVVFAVSAVDPFTVVVCKKRPHYHWTYWLQTDPDGKVTGRHAWTTQSDFLHQA